ncbi:hypothetical protein D3C77_449500 [compost metagenome]
MLQGIGTVRRNAHFATEFAQHALGYQLVHRVVFHQQDARTTLAVCSAVLGVGVDAVGAVQRTSQHLVQGIAGQGAGLLLQWGKMHGLFTGEKVAIGGHQQDRCLNLRAKHEQVVQIVGDQQVRQRFTQFVDVAVVSIVQSPVREQGLQQLSQSAAGIGQGGNATAQLHCGHRWGVAGQRQFSAELAAEAGLRTDAQAALHGFAEVIGQGQPQTGPAILAGNTGTGLDKGLEDAHLSLVGNADASVADVQAHAAGVGVQTHVDTTEARELECVGQQVADNLAYTGRVAKDHGGKLRIDQAGQLDTGGGVL